MSYYDPYQDIERLKIQSDIHMAIDRRAIDKALTLLASRKRTIKVLDVGCGDGTVTLSRFGSAPFVVLAVDVNADAIDQARKVNASSNIEFQCFDILDQPLCGPFDLIWCSQFLQHVRNPETALDKIWSNLAPGGVVVFRNSDDGMDTTYPPIIGFDALISASRAFSNSSDRIIGRKLYNYLKTYLNPQASFVDIQFEAVSNHDKSPEQRSELFDVRHGFRLPALRKAFRGSNVLQVEGLNYSIEYFEDVFIRAREAFIYDDSTISFSVQFLAFAHKPRVGNER